MFECTEPKVTSKFHCFIIRRVDVKCGYTQYDCYILFQVYHKLGLEDEWEMDDDDDNDDENSNSPKELAPSLCHPLCQCDKCRKYQQV